MVSEQTPVQHEMVGHRNGDGVCLLWCGKLIFMCYLGGYKCDETWLVLMYRGTKLRIMEKKKKLNKYFHST